MSDDKMVQAATRDAKSDMWMQTGCWEASDRFLFFDVCSKVGSSDPLSNWTEQLEKIRSFFVTKRKTSTPIHIPSLPPHILFSADLFRLCCRHLKTDEFSEEAFCSFCSYILKEELSLSNASIFIETNLLSRIRALSQPVSRALYTAHMDMLSHHPSAVASCLLFPLITSDADCGVPQKELVLKLLQSLSVEAISSLLQKVIVHYTHTGVPWTHTTVTGLKVLLERGELDFGDDDMFDKIVAEMHHNFNLFANDVMFIGVVSQFISKYLDRMRRHADVFIADLQKSKLFLAKMSIQKLESLKKEG